MSNPFIKDYLPHLFWPAEIQTFGTKVTYVPVSNPLDEATVKVLWKEGASDEEVSPGRYSHIDVRDADLPAPPALGDAVQKDERQYQVVRVEALAIGFSVLVLQESGSAV
jgi:hypothetical protein